MQSTLVPLKLGQLEIDALTFSKSRLEEKIDKQEEILDSLLVQLDDSDSLDPDTFARLCVKFQRISDNHFNDVQYLMQIYHILGVL